MLAQMCFGNEYNRVLCGSEHIGFDFYHPNVNMPAFTLITVATPIWSFVSHTVTFLSVNTVICRKQGFGVAVLWLHSWLPFTTLASSSGRNKLAMEAYQEPGFVGVC